MMAAAVQTQIERRSRRENREPLQRVLPVEAVASKRKEPRKKLLPPLPPRLAYKPQPPRQIKNRRPKRFHG